MNEADRSSAAYWAKGKIQDQKGTGSYESFGLWYISLGLVILADAIFKGLATIALALKEGKS